jgi:hypothetical protein
VGKLHPHKFFRLPPSKKSLSDNRYYSEDTLDGRRGCGLKTIVFGFVPLDGSLSFKKANGRLCVNATGTALGVWVIWKKHGGAGQKRFRLPGCAAIGFEVTGT